MPPRAAVIDLGSLAVRLHVAEARPSRPGEDPPDGTSAPPFRTLHEDRRVSRLAEHLLPANVLSERGQRAVLGILAEFRQNIDRLGVPASMRRIVATEVCRRAANGPEFAARIETETGIPVRILTPEEEAGWTARGALLAGTPHPRPVLVADPGGGSVELIWVDQAWTVGGAAPLRWGSEPCGVLVLLRRFPLKAPAQKDRLARLENAATGAMRRLLRRVRPPGAGPPASLVVTGGTALNLAAMSRRTPPGRVRSHFETAVAGEELEAIHRRLAAEDIPARQREPFLERGREDVIVHGLALLRGLLAASGTPGLTITHFGLREGVLEVLLSRGGADQVGS